MNWLDILILVPLVFFAWQGIRNGLIMEIFTLAALLLGIWASLKFSYVAETFLQDKLSMDASYLHIIAFILTFIVVVIAVNLLGKGIKKLFHAIALGPVDTILGLAFGAIKGILLLAILFYVFDNFERKNDLIDQKIKEESFFYPYIENLSNKMEEIVFDEKRPDFDQEKNQVNDFIEETFNI
ncbi:MAG: CvpA family protein [Bacteroidales bacterium]|nr:CvpA family protein [Bacteroidales bacterium]MDD3961867.1 CvpA family protein [Bacteroidales bacterium]HPE87217.1 CvpA family protein [Bacteroidales bacterium]